jgi:hypothetical protein
VFCRGSDEKLLEQELLKFVMQQEHDQLVEIFFCRLTRSRYGNFIIGISKFEQVGSTMIFCGCGKLLLLTEG